MSGVGFVLGGTAIKYNAQTALTYLAVQCHITVETSQHSRPLPHQTCERMQKGNIERCVATFHLSIKILQHALIVTIKSQRVTHVTSSNMSKNNTRWKILGKLEFTDFLSSPLADGVSRESMNWGEAAEVKPPRHYRDKKYKCQYRCSFLATGLCLKYACTLILILSWNQRAFPE